MSGQVLKLTDAVTDVRYESVRDTLERVLQRMDAGAKDGGTWHAGDFEPTKCALVFVDERNGGYRIRTLLSSMKLSDCVALLELAKLCEARRMGFERLDEDGVS